jgi:hypothetical protein
VVQPEGHLGQPPAELLDPGEPPSYEFEQIFQGQSAIRCAGSIKYRQARDMGDGPPGFDVQELRVERAELAHRLASSPVPEQCRSVLDRTDLEVNGLSSVADE